MRTQSKFILFLLLIPTLLFATDGKFDGKYTKEKKINKEYNVNADAGLKVSNSYGNIDIVTWNENRTVIEVLIRTNGNNEENVQKRLDEITVDFTANSSLVTAKTLFKNKNKSWSWWGSKKKNVSVEVNYTIKIPITNSVDLNNNYGSISLNKLKGNAKISCDYGQIIIGELLADNNSLNFDYTTIKPKDLNSMPIIPNRR
jgi:Holliday junction resolvase-like predicted endonuclease